MKRLLRPERPIGSLCVLFALLALVAGCSALRVGYNQADTFVYLWADRYIDFDEVQAPRVKDAIAAWFAWHRKSELNDYHELLTKADSEILADTTPERACAWWTAIRTRVDRAADRTVPAIAEIAVTLTPAQLANIEKRHAKTNKEWRDDFLQGDPAVRLAESAKRTVSRYETLYGSLDTFQKERLERWAAESPFDPRLAFEERKRRQSEALQALERAAKEKDPASAQQHIRTWLKRFDPSPNDAYRQLTERIMRHNCRVYADLHNSMSPDQRQMASKRLKRWAADLRALAHERTD